MTSKATSVTEYLELLPADKKAAVTKLRNIVKKNIPKGFKEEMSYGMIGYVVPHSIYPDGYHCDPKLPLPFVCIAAQKNFIAVYHMGVYAVPALLKWFTDEYKKQVITKLDMGKSCIRFKKPDDIPFELIGELMKQITVQEWISYYESNYKNARKKA